MTSPCFTDRYNNSERELDDFHGPSGDHTAASTPNVRLLTRYQTPFQRVRATSSVFLCLSHQTTKIESTQC
jgi:hypothetical protein